eukprot:Gb_07033 [translate_table: standard]
MVEKEGNPKLSILSGLVRTPCRSLGSVTYRLPLPRRVLVDSKGREVVQTPQKYPRTPLSKPSKLRHIQSGPGACSAPSEKGYETIRLLALCLRRTRYNLTKLSSPLFPRRVAPVGFVLYHATEPYVPTGFEPVTSPCEPHLP